MVEPGKLTSVVYASIDYIL